MVRSLQVRDRLDTEGQSSSWAASHLLREGRGLKVPIATLDAFSRSTILIETCQVQEQRSWLTLSKVCTKPLLFLSRESPFSPFTTPTVCYHNFPTDVFQ